ncbi:MAG TPA: flavodoxin domain-containing protein [Lentimicrobium sp.]|nr:flavodoxin domain-containing protein [Lentimicrobium sp.]
MIVLIYDSLFGNTAIIAKKLAETARSLGNELVEMKVNEADTQVILKADMLIIGSPTQSFNASKPMLEFLEHLDAKIVSNKKTIVFDTRIALESIDSKFLRWLVNRGGYATAPISKKLKKKGAQILGTQGFKVTDREGPLAEGEVERASEWIKSLLEL